MRRRKREMIVALALAVAIAAIAPMTAQARVSDGARYPAWASELEAPYWFSKTGRQTDYPAWATELVAPYWWSKSGTVVTSPDDRAFARAMQVETARVVSDDGRRIEFNAYTTSGLVLALLLAISSGMGLGVWHSRRTKLSPA